MLGKTYDIIVIGAGPGGYVAAIRAAQLGAKVLVIEKDKIGGVCLNRGCIPTKALIASVATLKTLKRAGSLGIEIQDAKFNLAKVLERKKRIVEQLREGIKFLFKKNGVELVKGVATIKDKRSVLVEIDHKSKQELKTKKIIVATGSESLSLPQFSFDGNKIISSTEALNLIKVPQSILIIGAGAVGVEFATIFSGLGAKVILIEMLSRIIPNEDEELSRELEKFFKTEGIEVLTSTKIKKIISEGERLKAVTDNGKELIVEKILVAVGRKLNSQKIGLENVGVKTESGRILVNRKMQTNISDIYAIGDVTGGTLLAHKASKEGIVAAESSLGFDSTMDYSAVPSCIYTLPEVASVGMTEEKARAEEIRVKIGKFPFSVSGKAIIQGEGKGFVKIVAEARSGRVLGVQIIGYKATDLIAIGVLAVRFKMTLQQLSHTIFAHPTLSETLMEAAGVAERKAIHLPPQR